MVTRTEAIKNFLLVKTHEDLANLYSYDMECQVNVAQDGGERLEGDFKGRQWHGWTDGITTWKSFRIPYNAKSNPEYEDKELKFDLAEHAEGIGMTGWDWKNRVSRWVAFDFDAITGHSIKHTKKLSDQEMKRVREAASNIDWVTIRSSTSGRGLHLYVFLDEIETKTHTEHAALARAILGKLAALTNYDFYSKVDVCGGNMWVWHRRMTGLNIIKQGAVLKDVPTNWKEHVSVISGKKPKLVPGFVFKNDKLESVFEELVGQRAHISLDAEHQKLIDFLQESKAQWWWDQDHNMLITHTVHLQEAHTQLELKGIFSTISEGKDYGQDHNCFLFPLRDGAWTVRRYTPGVEETQIWEQDGTGWTRCYFNRPPDLRIAARAYEGIEHPKGGYVFKYAESAMNAANLLGINLDIPPIMMGRKTKLKMHGDKKLLVEFIQEDGDNLQGWLAEKKKWIKLFNMPYTIPDEPEIKNYDDLIRHLITESGDDYGWILKSENEWRVEPLQHVKIALESLGVSYKDAKTILGSLIFKGWKLVNKPFQPEYPGNRQWNRNAPQYRFLPSENKDSLKFPTWLKILQHCGKNLNDAVSKNPWAKANGVLTGADYLKCWFASLLQEPLEPLPYLFLYGPQNSGKSILHEAFSMLITCGYQRADAALISQSGFNGELENSVLCVVEETDLKIQKTAYNRIKDWVTSKQLLIHRKQRTPYHVPNTTHWVQCSNESSACPVSIGDTRIVMVFVDLLNPADLIPKKQIFPLLKQEANDFMAELLNLELPPSNDRLNIPIIVTEDKLNIEKRNQTLLELFISENCYNVPGEMIKFGEFYDKFMEWIDPEDMHKWSKIKVGRELPPWAVKGRLPENGYHYIGNISWHVSDKKLPKIIERDGYLKC